MYYNPPQKQQRGYAPQPAYNKGNYQRGYAPQPAYNKGGYQKGYGNRGYAPQPAYNNGGYQRQQYAPQPAYNKGGYQRQQYAPQPAYMKKAEEKKKRLEEAEAKRQEMLEAQKADKQGAGGAKKAGGAGGDARREMTKTKEQLEEEKKIALSIRIKPLDLDSMDTDDLKDKAKELFNIVIALETDKYDYEQRRITQDYELNELKERP